MCISLRIQCVPAENNVWNAETVAYIQTVANLKSFITQTKSIAYFWEVKQLKIACYANVFLLKIYYGMYLGSSRFEGDFMKIFGMSLQQYSNALQCNYVSLLFVQSTAATLTRAHRSMCQFRAMPVLPSPLSACLPACCQLWQTKEAATSAAATTSFPFLYSAATLPMTSDREAHWKQTSSTRQFICSNSYSCNCVS